MRGVQGKKTHTRMSVLRAPMAGRLGSTLSAQSRPMLLRTWQMRLPWGRCMHHGVTCRQQIQIQQVLYSQSNASALQNLVLSQYGMQMKKC